MTIYEEKRKLPCGCLVGRSVEGRWFYDYICDVHVKEVYDENGKFSYDKHMALTERLQKEMSQ